MNLELSKRYPITSKFCFAATRRHTILQGAWSSDVCSSDLLADMTPDDPLATALDLTNQRRDPERVLGAENGHATREMRRGKRSGKHASSVRRRRTRCRC